MRCACHHFQTRKFGFLSGWVHGPRDQRGENNALHRLHLKSSHIITSPLAPALGGGASPPAGDRAPGRVSLAPCPAYAHRRCRTSARLVLESLGPSEGPAPLQADRRSDGLGSPPLSAGAHPLRAGSSPPRWKSARGSATSPSPQLPRPRWPSSPAVAVAGDPSPPPGAA